MSKLLVIVGVTGNQGSSVANRFLKDKNYRIRGLTRNPNSLSAKDLASKGIEIVQADLNDPATLVPAFANANLIFSVTNYWEPFFNPSARQTAESQGISCAKYAYDVEYQQGKNIADAAAATVDTLDENGFIASTLSSARECSGGKFQEVYHFDAKADVFPGYVEEVHPQLAARMSCVQTGCFMTSYRLAMSAYFSKQADGTFLTRFPMSPTTRLQHVDINADCGPFVYAVSRRPPRGHYMAAGTTCTWPEYAATWSKATGQTCTYQQISLDEFVDGFQDRWAGTEIGVMFAYSEKPGYDGGMKGVVGAEELRAAGVECPTTSLEEFMGRQDWSEVINQ